MTTGSMPLTDAARVRASMVEFVYAINKLPADVAASAFARIVIAATRFGIDVGPWCTAVLEKALL